MDMNRENLIDEWLAEERAAHIHGWDFSRIDGKFDEERDLPWNYENLIKQHLSPDVKLLDIDTGGGRISTVPESSSIQSERNRSLSP